MKIIIAREKDATRYISAEHGRERDARRQSEGS